jgi:hypothetical protein
MLKLRQMETYGVQMKRILSWLRRWARRASTRHFILPWLPYYTLQRHNTENSKQMFPEKELRGLSPDIHINVSVSDLYTYF